MKADFQPEYKKFDTDIKRYIVSIGKCERRKDGTITLWGYEDALQYMFRLYLEHGALDLLVAHFRRWNWEHTYNQYLHNLTAALIAQPNWPLLQNLWDSVIAKRRKIYNDIWKIKKDSPGYLPETHLPESKEALLEALARVRSFAETYGAPGDTNKYIEMAARVEKGRRA